jgi:formate-dependent nitrite reductase membrane component NrfD
MTTAEGAQDARRGWLPWLLAPLVLPALGAAAVMALTEAANLDDWAPWQAAAALGAAILVPALLAAWVGRRGGVVEAVAWGLACVGVEVALVFGVGFLALGLGAG